VEEKNCIETGWNETKVLNNNEKKEGNWVPSDGGRRRLSGHRPALPVARGNQNGKLRNAQPCADMKLNSLTDIACLISPHLPDRS
jgi:hypothetical protein